MKGSMSDMETKTSKQNKHVHEIKFETLMQQETRYKIETKKQK